MVATNDETTNEICAAEVPQTTTISDEEFEKAQKTFQMGKKNLFLNKFDESVNNIAEACKIYANKYGELDSQCAEIYFFYGKALLELARVENTVLGNALNGVPEDNEPIDDSRYGNPEDIPAEEKEEISEKVIEALCDTEDKKTTETTTTTVEPMITTTETPVEENKTETTTTGEVAVTEKEETKKEENGEEEADEEEEEEEEDGEDITKNDEQVKDEAEADEISNLQRSWEMFELAKLVYKKHFDSDVIFKNKRIAECLLKLGEISIEQEFYEQAINDIGESIKLQEETKDQDRDERMLAESFYQLGLAQQFHNLFSDANESYQKSINIMQMRVEKLKAKLTALGDTTNDADIELEKTTLKDEIAELEALLPEMTGKLEEVTEQGQQSLNLIKEAKECFINSITSNGGCAAPVNGGEVKDITCMVKSKRKIDETVGEDNTIKKTRLSGTEINITSTEINGDTTKTTTIEINESKTTIEPTENEEKITIDEDKPTSIIEDKIETTA